jgi:PAS domain-containing protein
MRGEDDPPTPVSHGMCEGCYEHFTKQWDHASLGEYMDAFDLPVAAVDGDGRIIAVNQKMAERLGKPNREVAGLLGGEMFECVNSRLPEGCGKTLRCDACTIRNTVNQTRASGLKLSKVRAYLSRDEGATEILISTECKDGVVILTLEPG